MCLKNISEKKIATENITCYKILQKRYDDSLYSAVYHADFYYNPGQKYTSTIELTVYKGTNCTIEKALHSFAYVSDAISEFRILSAMYPRLHFALCEFTIPKDSTYYEGIYSDAKSFASDTIIFNKELNKESDYDKSR